MKRNSEVDDIINRVYNQAREIAMNDLKRIKVENRERWLINQNSIKAYEREQRKIESKLETTIKLLDMGLSMKQVITVTDLSENEIQAELKKISN